MRIEQYEGEIDVEVDGDVEDILDRDRDRDIYLSCLSHLCNICFKYMKGDSGRISAADDKIQIINCNLIHYRESLVNSNRNTHK